ncbi:MAG: amino acid aminotransferase [Pseudomonadota bacterium]
MLDELEQLPGDAILGIAAACQADPNPDKVDLTVGIYMDEDGVCPVFEAIRLAQQQLIAEEVSKSYLPPAGVAGFNEGMQQLVLGADNDAVTSGRVTSIQAPGGCGALRIAAELVYSATPDATVWVSDPSWPNHLPLLGSVGLTIAKYRYYDPVSHGVNFDAMVDDLKQTKAGDVVLIHGCCHNPCGADLSSEQWERVGDLAEQRGFIPFIDFAYQGLGEGLDADAVGIRSLVRRLPEMMVASSCSKNMGLYRERTGCAIFLGQDADTAAAVLSQAKVAARKVYSMPPAHGALLASKVLGDAALRKVWESELNGMCERINRVRTDLVEKVNAATGRDFGFIEAENGMFSFLGLNGDQVARLRDEYSVYMVGSSRINVAGVNSTNVDYLAASIASVL